MHRAALICFDNTVIKEINTTIYNFVWKGKDKVTRMALISDYKDGGLKMPHIESVVKTQGILCVKRFLDERDSPWKKFLSYYLKNVGSAFFLQCNFSTAFLPSTLPQFYKECLVAWADLFQRTPETSNDVLNAIIWNDKDIQIGGKPIYNKRLVDSGFKRVRDILSNDNKLKKLGSY